MAGSGNKIGFLHRRSEPRDFREQCLRTQPVVFRKRLRRSHFQNGGGPDQVFAGHDRRDEGGMTAFELRLFYFREKQKSAQRRAATRGEVQQRRIFLPTGHAFAERPLGRRSGDIQTLRQQARKGGRRMTWDRISLITTASAMG